MNQPLSNQACHPVEIFPLRKLMVRSRQNLKMFLNSQRVKESSALMKRDVLILVTLDDEGRRADRSCRVIGNSTQSIVIKGIAEPDSVRTTHDIGNRVRCFPSCHLIVAEFQT